MNEKDYMQGNRAAYLSILRECLGNLGDMGDSRELLALERAETVMALRSLCEDFGFPNDWPTDLHLGDVIIKYIRPGIEDYAKEEDIYL